jgi:hypothetical protein
MEVLRDLRLEERLLERVGGEEMGGERRRLLDRRGRGLSLLRGRRHGASCSRVRLLPS